MGHTLILNSDWTPLSVVPLSTCLWRDAIRLYYEDKVQIRHTYDNWTVSSPSLTMHVPSVVLLKAYVRANRRIGYGKPKLWMRDNYTCQYCAQKFPASDLTVDHVVPQSLGGESSTYLNLVAACGPCNWKRGNNIRIQPRRAPYVPSVAELSQKRRLYPISIPHASWAPYIGWPEHLISVVEPTGEPGYVPAETPPVVSTALSA